MLDGPLSPSVVALLGVEGGVIPATTEPPGTAGVSSTEGVVLCGTFAATSFDPTEAPTELNARTTK
jgi:hypothetical protein